MAGRNGAKGGRSSCGVVGSLTLLMMMMMMMIAGAVAQSGAAPAPAVDCETVVFSLSDCLTYVMGNETTPPAACCSELKTVINTTPQCLCLLFNTTFTQPLGVNITIAQQLPPACKLKTPPTSLCSLVGIPVSGPVASVAPSPVTTAPATSPMAPSPTSMSPLPATTPSAAPAGSMPASAPAPMMTVPSTGSTVPAGAPAASANSTTNPNGAPSITSQKATVAALVLLLVSVVLS